VNAREYLFSLEQFGIKLGLDQIRALLADLGRPDRAFPAVLIAGTNGKGSVAAMTERGLRAAGYRTGRYTSPHLVHVEERICVDGRPMDPAAFDTVAERVRRAANGLAVPPSFFEATTAVALEAFRSAAVDLAVLEVGMGGRLDATNVLSPVAVGITAIDFDHEAYLGSTIEAIAREKAGIIKAGAVCVLARNRPEVRAIAEDACRSAGATLVYAPQDVRLEAALTGTRTRMRVITPRNDYGDIVLSLRGRHQVDNAVAAVRLLEELAACCMPRVSAAAVRAGLTDAEWPGRLELRRTSRGEVLIDGAHNPAGARALAAYLQEAYGRRLPIVIGVMRDKSIEPIIAALAPCAAAFICTAPRSSRAAAPADVAAAVRRQAPEVPVQEIETSRAAVDAALPLGQPVVVAGSLYLAGEIRAEWS
jgi:dihydrofolate synthase/folylpolyglutamate synthase